MRITTNFANSPEDMERYREGDARFFHHVFNIGRHGRFDDPATRRLVERLAPEHLLHGSITASRAQHGHTLKGRAPCRGG